MGRLNIKTPQAVIGVLLVLIGLVLLAGSPVGAGGGAAEVAQDTLAVEPATIEFGKVAQAAPLEATVSITNSGEEPVEILDVEAS